MSDTPRTDNQSGWSVRYGGRSLSEDLWMDRKGPYVPTPFARLLERELIAANERIKRLEQAGDYLCAAAAFMGWHDKIADWNKAKEAKP